MTVKLDASIALLSVTPKILEILPLLVDSRRLYFNNYWSKKIVDHLFVVQEVAGTYQYQLISNEVDVSNFSKTRYIPVTMADLFLKINDLDGKVAVSGVACFIKAIRLKQHYNPDLREKIPFLVGIICGGLKSRFFTDFLVQKAGIYGDYSRQDYRIKDLSSTALDYSFGAFDQQGKHHTIKMKTVGDMWGTGLFKSHACDLCTDVLTELADISLGDAWLDGYREDGAGNSVIVTRSAVAEALIREGLQKELLHLDEVDHTLIVKSQQASYRHRQDGIAFRAKVFKRFGKRLPKLRLMKSKKISLSYAMVQLQRLVVRRNSLKFWEDSPSIIRFDKKMKPSLFVLKVLTKIHHKLK